MSDDDLADRLTDLEARVDALNRARTYLQDRVDELEAENERLRERVADLEGIVDPDPSARDYAQLTKQQKVHRVRRTLVDEAARSDGTARLQYKDVKWLFDWQPSTGHCYDLMEVAANLDGFVYDSPGGSGGQKRIRVKLDAVNDETLVHAANNATAGGAPQDEFLSVAGSTAVSFGSTLVVSPPYVTLRDPRGCRLWNGVERPEGNPKVGSTVVHGVNAAPSGTRHRDRSMSTPEAHADPDTHDSRELSVEISRTGLEGAGRSTRPDRRTDRCERGER